MIKILVCGIAGHMGRNICELLKNDAEAEAVCGVDLHAPENFGGNVYKNFSEVNEKADVVIDFSSPACLNDEMAYCTKHGVPAVYHSGRSAASSTSPACRLVSTTSAVGIRN